MGCGSSRNAKADREWEALCDDNELANRVHGLWKHVLEYGQSLNDDDSAQDDDVWLLGSSGDGVVSSNQVGNRDEIVAKFQAYVDSDSAEKGWLSVQRFHVEVNEPCHSTEDGTTVGRLEFRLRVEVEQGNNKFYTIAIKYYHNPQE